jgi:hypothetical protein
LNKHYRTAFGYCNSFIKTKHAGNAVKITIQKIKKVDPYKDQIELNRFVDKSTMENLKALYGQAEEAFGRNEEKA